MDGTAGFVVVEILLFFYISDSGVFVGNCFSVLLCSYCNREKKTGDFFVGTKTFHCIYSRYCRDFVLPLFAMLPDRSESVYRICSVCGYLVLPLEMLCAFEVRKHQKTRIVGYALLGGTVLIGIFLVIFIGWQPMDHFVYFKTILAFGYPLLFSVFFTPFSIFIVERLYSTKRGGEEQQRERVQA